MALINETSRFFLAVRNGILLSDIDNVWCYKLCLHSLITVKTEDDGHFHIRNAANDEDIVVLPASYEKPELNALECRSDYVELTREQYQHLRALRVLLERASDQTFFDIGNECDSCLTKDIGTANDLNDICKLMHDVYNKAKMAYHCEACAVIHTAHC